jgi:hypothetical protein
MREIDNVDPPARLPEGEPLAEWRVSAIGPGWRPVPGESELLSVPGRLQLYPEALVFVADEVVDRSTGEPVVGIVPAGSVTHTRPLAPGTMLAPSEPAGRWMRGPLRRFRIPGFALGTAGGLWAFDCPQGARRAEEISRRYARVTA